jgi:hypothetical protein
MPVRLRIAAPVVAAAIVAFAVITMVTAPAPTTIDYEAAQSQFDNELGSLDMSPIAAADPGSKPAPAPLPKPPMGPVAAPWISVYGDLTAKTIANVLAWREPDNTDAMFTDGIYDWSCSLLRGTTVRDSAGAHGNLEACDRRDELWPQMRASTGSSVAIVSVGVQDLFLHDLDGSGTWRAVGDPEFDVRVAAELDDMIATMAAPDSALVVANLPTDWSVLGADRPWNIGEQTYVARAQALNALIAAAVARHPEVTLLDIDGWFNGNGGGATLRPGGGALSIPGMTAFGNWLGGQAVAVNQAAAQRRYDAMPAPTSATEPGSSGRPTRVLVAGDSTAVNLAVGLRGHAAAFGDIEVGSVARANCGMAPGGQRLNGWGVQNDPCPDDLERVRDAAQRFRPDVVVVVDVLWELTDRKLPGDDTWRSMGDPVYERFLRERLNQMYDALTSTGAHLVLVQYPLIQTGLAEATKPAKPYPANDPARMVRWNGLLQELASTRPRASVADLRTWLIGQPGGELEASTRPDGLHYTAEFGRTIADGFLAAALIDAGTR